MTGKKKKVKKKSHSLVYKQVVSTFGLLFLSGNMFFIFLGYIPKGGISGSNGNSMFNFLRKR